MAVSARERLSWNPLRCSGTPLAPHVLLAAKLVAVCLLAANAQTRLDLGLPLESVLRGVLVGAAAALLFNRSVRSTAFLVGASALAASWRGAPSIDSATVFSGVLLTFAAFQGGSTAPRVLQGFVAAAHLVLAALFWRGLGPWPSWAAPAFAALGLMLPARPVRLVGLWFGVFLQAAALWFGFSPPLSYALLASYLVFAPWPNEKLTVLYDGDCGFCETTRRFFERLDFDRIYDWHPFQDGAGDRWGIPTAALERAAHVVADGRVYAGFRAFQALTLYNPLTYFVLAALLLSARAFLPAAQPVIAALAIALYFPLFRRLGEAVYQLIARNRHRLPGEKTCKVA